MKKREKNKIKNKKNVFSVSFLASLPFFLLLNFLAAKLPGFYFQEEALSADLSRKILGEQVEKLKIEREEKKRFENLDIEAKAALAVEFDQSGKEKILFKKNSDQTLTIASLTKLMTALVVFEMKEIYNPDQLIEISKEALVQEGASKYGDLRPGEKLSAESLLAIMLIESSNDAAFALTEPLGEPRFVDLMNLYAQKIGLENTNFANPTGLEPEDPSEPKNLSTARDLFRLAKYILENQPEIFGITASQSYLVFTPQGEIHHFIPRNTNELLGEIPGIIGGKTGWEVEAGGCLLLVLKNRQGDYFINVVLAAPDRFSEMRKLINAINL